MGPGGSLEPWSAATAGCSTALSSAPLAAATMATQSSTLAMPTTPSALAELVRAPGGGLDRGQRRAQPELPGVHRIVDLEHHPRDPAAAPHSPAMRPRRTSSFPLPPEPKGISRGDCSVPWS